MKMIENVTCTPAVFFNMKNDGTSSNAGDSQNTGERFFCTVCGKNYLRKRHLQRHMRDECIGIPPRFECEFCPSKFRRKYHLVRHLNSRHSESITEEHSGIIVNNRSRSNGKHEQHDQIHNAIDNDENDDIGAVNLNIKKENLSMNAVAAAAAVEFASALAKDFSVDAIMMKREQCEQGLPLELKFFEELQKKMNLPINADLFARQMNPIKY